MMGQTGRIVVGYDGSESAVRAVEWAAVEAARSGKRLIVFYVIDYGRFVTGGGNSGATGWGAYLADEPARRLVDDGVTRARTADRRVHVSGLTQVGRPFAALVDASRTADLMVVGTRGHGRLRSVVEQSVSASVAAHAHCPVVIVRGRGDVRIGPAHPVVVGVDGSAASQAALDHAAAVARDSSAPLTVVCAWNNVARHATWVGVDTRVVIERDGMLGAERRAARAILDAAVARVRAAYPQMGVTASLVEAAPAAALLPRPRTPGWSSSAPGATGPWAACCPARSARWSSARRRGRPRSSGPRSPPASGMRRWQRRP